VAFQSSRSTRPSLFRRFPLTARRSGRLAFPGFRFANISAIFFNWDEVLVRWSLGFFTSALPLLSWLCPLSIQTACVLPQIPCVAFLSALPLLSFFSDSPVAPIDPPCGLKMVRFSRMLFSEKFRLTSAVCRPCIRRQPTSIRFVLALDSPMDASKFRQRIGKIHV